MVGAGTVVTKDVAPYTVIAGNPVKLLGILRNKNDRLSQLEKNQ